MPLVDTCNKGKSSNRFAHKNHEHNNLLPFIKVDEPILVVVQRGVHVIPVCNVLNKNNIYELQCHSQLLAQFYVLGLRKLQYRT